MIRLAREGGFNEQAHLRSGPRHHDLPGHDRAARLSYQVVAQQQEVLEDYNERYAPEQTLMEQLSQRPGGFAWDYLQNDTYRNLLVEVDWYNTMYYSVRGDYSRCSGTWWASIARRTYELHLRERGEHRRVRVASGEPVELRYGRPEESGGAELRLPEVRAIPTSCTSSS